MRYLHLQTGRSGDTAFCACGAQVHRTETVANPYRVDCPVCRQSQDPRMTAARRVMDDDFRRSVRRLYRGG